MIRRPPEPTFFPSTTLFRSSRQARRSRRAFSFAPQIQEIAMSTQPKYVLPTTEAAAVEAPLARLYFGESLTEGEAEALLDRKSTRLNSSHANISYAVFCLKK